MNNCQRLRVNSCFCQISIKACVCKIILSLSLMLLLLPPFNILAQNTTRCIDLSDLSASNIHCTYGSFYNPYQYEGIVNGRHTVITQQGIDPETNGGLQMIPQGQNYSIRLGNSDVGAEAESISCDIIVDTNNYDLLILKYAAVMENPNHSPSHQPRFKFDILNIQDEAIDPNCLSADFVSNSSLGWHTNGGVLWKDWTNVGVDISDYHGETIRIRLTTYDCEESGHFGYAYFVLACGEKTVEQCGDIEEYTYWAPDGFTYEWHWMDDMSQILSTNQSVNVPVGGQRTLLCHLSFIGNPDCGFDLYSHTEFMYPIPEFSVQETDCNQTFTFVNQSAISNDGINPNGTGELCDNAFWDFGDGQTSYAISPTHSYSFPGDYTVMMVAGLHDFDCTDTIYHTVTVPPNTVFDTLSCEYFLWNGVTYTETGTYYQNLTTIHGCDSLVTVNLIIENDVTNYFEDMGCDNYTWNGIEYNLSDQYQQLFQNQFGCDSLVTLNLDMEYYPSFQIVGDHYPMAGTEEEYNIYEYEIDFLNPLSSADSVRWTLSNHNGFDIQPLEGGLKAKLYLYGYSMDSIEIKVYVYNRCGVEEYSFWFHTTYYGVEDKETMPLFDIFPNPNNGEFELRFQHVEGLIGLKVYDFKGKEVLKKDIKSDATMKHITIDLNKCPNGLYFIQINYDGRSYINRFLINR